MVDGSFFAALERQRDLPVPCEDPRLLGLWPLIYVAWADGALSSRELAIINDKVTTAFSESQDGPRASVDRWLDPEHPPSAEALQNLLIAIQEGAACIPRAKKQSLAELGTELAKRGGYLFGDQERAALHDVEHILGFGNEATARFQTNDQPEPAELLDTTEPLWLVPLKALIAGKYAPVKQRLRQLLCTDAFDRPEEPTRTQYRETVLHWCRLLAEHGFGGLSFPREKGGGGDLGAFIAAFETLAEHDLSLLVKFGVQFGLFGGAIHQLGTEPHHRRYLQEIASLELPGCFAMTETGHGSNVAGLETTATYLSDEMVFEIHTPNSAATKDYIGNAACHARLAVVFAQLYVNHHHFGVHALIVPIRDEQGQPLSGITIEDCGPKLGLNGVDNGRIRFHKVRVPREHLLDRFARVNVHGHYQSPIISPNRRFFTMLGTLVGGRISVAGGSLTAAKSALTIAIRYAAIRRQFGSQGQSETLLLDYPTHQRKLMPLLATSYALDFALKHLVSMFVDRHAEEGYDMDRREIETQAAALKAMASWHATQTIQTCREACGGKGYLSENRFAALKADTDVFTTFEGDNTVLLQLVAKSLLSGYKQQFHEQSLLGLVRLLTERAVASVAARNPWVAHQSDRDHLRDGEFQLKLMRWREQQLLTTVASRLKKRLEAGMDSIQAFSQCGDHLQSLARAFAERVVLERFQATIENCDHGGLTEVLERLCDLFALTSMERDRGWFLENGNFEGAKARAVRRLAIELCASLRGDALPLLDGFGIPDKLLAAPIAFAPEPLEAERFAGDD